MRGVVTGMGQMKTTSGREGKVLFLDLGGSFEGFHFLIYNSAINLFYASFHFIIKKTQNERGKGRRAKGRRRREGGEKKEKEKRERSRSPLKYRWKETICLLPNKTLGGSKNI